MTTTSHNIRKNDITKHIAALIISFAWLTTSAFAITPSQIKWNAKGAPPVIHYDKNDFHGDTQFWCMAEDEEGILYFGNNDGIVIYDGGQWHKISLPNKSTVRSLICTSDGTIYAGGFNEIGEIHKDEYGTYHYTSLTTLLRPEDRNFNDVWQIHETEQLIVFRTFNMLIAISNKKAITIPASDRFTKSAVIKDQYFVSDYTGIKKLDFQHMEFDLIVPASLYHNEEMSAILPGSKTDEIMIYTKPGNSYLLNPQTHEGHFFKNHLPENSSDQIFCALKSSNNLYYLGTINNQVITFEMNGQKSIENRIFNELQDKTVLNLYETKEGNIWALLNKGLDCITTNAPVSVIFNNAAIFDALELENTFYIATNQGVYFAQTNLKQQYLTRHDFNMISGLEAQAWSLASFENKILVGHNRGIYVIDKNNHYHIEGTQGIWKVINFKDHPNTYLACAYDGLYILKYQNNKFIMTNQIDGFNISGRDIMQIDQSNSFWVCHGYQGIYKIKIDNELRRTISFEHYDPQNGLPSMHNINVFEYNKQPVFTTTNGIYTYNPQKNAFEPDNELNNILGKNAVIRRIQKQNEKTWFVKNEELGYFEPTNLSNGLHTNIFLSLKGSFIKGMELIHPIDTNKVLIGTNDGLYLYDLSYQMHLTPTKTRLTQVKYKNEEDSLIFCPLETLNQSTIQLPNKTSSLTLNYATPSFTAQNNIQYSYKLEEVDKNWSEWSSTTEKEYSFLKHGTYNFKVKSRSLLGETSTISSFPFEILPKWYQTQWAIWVFSIISICVATLIAVWVKRKIKNTRQKEIERRKVVELELHQIKLEREKQRIKKDKELLEEDVIHKSKELANYTMLLVRKRKLLTEMNQDLKSLKESVRNEKNREKIRTLTKRINLNLQNEEHLKIFDTNFERVHQEFFHELKSNYPDLTQKELRLCGFVKMNLSNKEIASILNISVRGVETARYRLRKRLSISHDVNMVEFLETLSSSSVDKQIESREAHPTNN